MLVTKQGHIFGRNFEEDIDIVFHNRMRNYEVCIHLWMAMSNITWTHNFFGTTFSPSFRYAGSLIANIRNKHFDFNEDYMKWYCSGPSGVVYEYIEEDLLRVGWHWQDA